MKNRRYPRLERSRKFSDVQITAFYVLLFFFFCFIQPTQQSSLYIPSWWERLAWSLFRYEPLDPLLLQRLACRNLRKNSCILKLWTPLTIKSGDAGCVPHWGFCCARGCLCVIVMVWGVFTERECEEVWDGVGERRVGTCGLPNPSISGMTAVTTSRCLGAQSDWLFTVNIALFTLQCVLFAPLAVSKLMLNPSTDP